MSGIFRGTGTTGTGVSQPDVSTRVAIAGDTMTGPLNVPAGATGTQVPQRQEIDTALALKANLISPVLVTPNLGTPSAGILTNCTGTAAGLTAGNVTTNANLTGEVTSVGNAATVTNSAVIGKVLTGFVSGAGTVAATDTILQAANKFDGNIAARALLAGSATQVFSVATATTANHAVNLAQFQTITAPTLTLSGSVTNPTTPVTTTAFCSTSGREVTIVAKFSAVDTTGASGNLQVTGLPVAADTALLYQGMVGMSGFGATPAMGIISGTTIGIYDQTSLATIAMSAGAGRSLYLQIKYFTA